ncbi:hypothetical protein BX070DRAFT_224002 [Coemansia spiralis]|nr:hypothetical protein BX070DRAFT_224002 [Coemansia spiralis]
MTKQSELQGSKGVAIVTIRATPSQSYKETRILKEPGSAVFIEQMSAKAQGARPSARTYDSPKPSHRNAIPSSFQSNTEVPLRPVTSRAMTAPSISSSISVQQSNKRQNKGKGSLGELYLNSFSLDAIRDNGGSRQGTKTAVTMHVHYPVDNAWRVVVFPPGVSIGQARDICMLKFNVWHRVMELEMMASTQNQDSSASAPFDHKQGKKKKSGNGLLDDDSVSATASTSSSSGCSSGSSGMSRDQYGLYWPAKDKWLDAMSLMSMYGFALDDVIELQDSCAFIKTNNPNKLKQSAPTDSLYTASTTIAPSFSCSTVPFTTPLATHEVISRKAEPEESLRSFGPSLLERKMSISPSTNTDPDCEGYLYYLLSKGVSTAWKLYWVELHGTTIMCFKKAASKSKPLLAIELSAGFRLVNQHLSDARLAEERSSNSFQSGSTPLSSSSSHQSASSISSLLGLVALSQQQLGNNSVPLILKCPSQVHVLCTQGIADYERWHKRLRALLGGDGSAPSVFESVAMAKSTSGVGSNGRGRAASQASEMSTMSLPRSTRMVARQEVFLFPKPAKPEDNSMSLATSLVHRPKQSRDGKTAPHVVLQPRSNSNTNSAATEGNAGRFESSAVVTLLSKSARVVPKGGKGDLIPGRLFHFVLSGSALHGYDRKEVAASYSYGNAMQLSAAADFSIDLRSSSNSCSNGHICVMQASAEDNTTVILILETADTGDFTAIAPKASGGGGEQQHRRRFRKLARLIVDGSDAGSQWINALCALDNIGIACTAGETREGKQGVQSNLAHGQKSTDHLPTLKLVVDDLASVERDLHGMSIRRSRSFVSTLSRADWPLPPQILHSSTATTPDSTDTSSTSGAENSGSNHQQRQLEGGARTVGSSTLSMFAAAIRQSDGNPSLDAVGMRFGRGGRDKVPLLIRFPWFRRNQGTDDA